MFSTGIRWDTCSEDLLERYTKVWFDFVETDSRTTELTVYMSASAIEDQTLSTSVVEARADVPSSTPKVHHVLFVGTVLVLCLLQSGYSKACRGRPVEPLTRELMISRLRYNTPSFSMLLA